MSKGIDVFTKYQNVTDWNAVRAAGYEFAYVKVSDGTSIKDDGGYGPKGRAAGLAMGAYHYAEPGDPFSQANLLVDRAVSAGLTDLAPALDLEAPFTANAASVAFAQTFLTRVAARGHTPCLYGSNSVLSYVLPRLNVPGLKVWVARYGAAPTVGYTDWQYSSSGHVPGIAASAVDLDEGAIPFDAATLPTVTRSANSNSSNDEESTVLVPAGTNEHVVIPAAGRPLYLYLYSAFGHTVTIHQMVFVGPTNAAGAGGSYLPGGTNTDWVFQADRPGPIAIPAGTAGVTLRYTSDHAFTAYVG